MVVQGCNYK